jgi:hypothetical protein
MEAGSPRRLLEALANAPSVEAGPSSGPRPSTQVAWADLDLQELPPPDVFFAGSPGLLRELLGRGPEGRLHFSDSEASLSSGSELEPETTDAKGKGVIISKPKRRRVRRHRHRRRAAGFLADARRAPGRPVAPSARPDAPSPPAPGGPVEPRRRSPNSHPARERGVRDSGRPVAPSARPDAPSPPAPGGPVEPRRRSPNSHPARERGVRDSEGFFDVQSKRFGRRRSSPRGRSPRSPGSPRVMPPELADACFNCLRHGHIRARCWHPPRCYVCWREGHLAARCPERGGRRSSNKRPRSPGHSGGRRHVRLRGRAESADTISGSSVSTGRSTSIPIICAASPHHPGTSAPPRPTPQPPTQADQEKRRLRTSLSWVGVARKTLALASWKTKLQSVPPDFGGVTRHW